MKSVIPRLHAAADNNADWRWMADPRQAGVGAFGDLGGHSLDVLLNWMGEVESCTADISAVLGNYGPCDETGQGLIKFTNGATANLFAGWANHANLENQPMEHKSSPPASHRRRGHVLCRSAL